MKNNTVLLFVEIFSSCVTFLLFQIKLLKLAPPPTPPISVGVMCAGSLSEAWFGSKFSWQSVFAYIHCRDSFLFSSVFHTTLLWNSANIQVRVCCVIAAVVKVSISVLFIRVCHRLIVIMGRPCEILNLGWLNDNHVTCHMITILLTTGSVILDFWRSNFVSALVLTVHRDRKLEEIGEYPATLATRCIRLRDAFCYMPSHTPVH